MDKSKAENKSLCQVTECLYVDEDGKVVEEGAPGARHLHATPGMRILLPEDHGLDSVEPVKAEKKAKKKSSKKKK